MLRVPKISSKPNEVSVSLSSTTSATLWSTPIQNDSVFHPKMASACEGGNKSPRTLRRQLWRRSHCPVFSPFRSLSPLPLSRMSSISRTQFFFSFLLFDFHVDVISSCVSGSHCLCLTGRLNVFLKTTDTATGCHVEKRKKKSAVSMERGRERKKSSSYRLAPSPLPLVKVCMCVYMCVSVRVCFFCANRQQAEAAERRWLSYVTCWDFVFGTPLCEKGFFCVLSSSSSLLLTPLSTHHSDPFLPPLPPCPPPQHTSKERKKLVHSWFGKKVE